MLLGTALLAASLTSCRSEGISGGDGSAYEKVNLSMAVNGTDTQIDSLVANRFAELVTERSGGNIVIDIFPNDTLAGGNSTKGVEYIAVGGSDLGANSTAMSWSKVFTAIQQGTIDGQENGCSITKSAKMDEIQDYMTIWNYSYENDLFVANTKIWESLEEETRQLLRECATEACEWGRDQLESDEERLIQEFRDGGIQVDVLTEEQLAAFQEAVAEVTAELKAVYGVDACAAFGMDME